MTSAHNDVPSVDQARFALIQRLADNKYWLGRRYAEWCTAAPTLESAVAASAMAQDEIGHARSQYPLFRQFVGHDVEPEDRDDFHSISTLDQSFAGWPDFIAVNLLVDTAITIVFAAACESSYMDLRNRARRIVGEESLHWLHAVGWLRKLSGASRGTRDALLSSLQGLWIETNMWFGPPDDPMCTVLLDSGTVEQLPSAMRREFHKRLSGILEGLMEVEIDENSLPWGRWDGERYRLRPA